MTNYLDKFDLMLKYKRSNTGSNTNTNCGRCFQFCVLYDFEEFQPVVISDIRIVLQMIIAVSFREEKWTVHPTQLVAS